VILVGVSLATQPENVAKLRGLTFATLEQSYRPVETRARAQFNWNVIATVALAAFVIGLWVHFA
jgi:hypothetical protein